jgi:hypothetical protein
MYFLFLLRLSHVTWTMFLALCKMLSLHLDHQELCQHSEWSASSILTHICQTFDDHYNNLGVKTLTSVSRVLIGMDKYGPPCACAFYYTSFMKPTLMESILRIDGNCSGAVFFPVVWFSPLCELRVQRAFLQTADQHFSFKLRFIDTIDHELSLR